MAFDFKKENKEIYLPDKKPDIILVPKMNYIAVRGQGDPNQEDGEYKQAIGLLYGIAFTIKMSKRETIRLTDISIMLFRRSKASGGRKALRESTMLIKRISGGFL